MAETADDTLRRLLDTETARINTPAFIADDPVRFPRRFTSLPDIETAALLASTLAWGNRKMIMRDCTRLFDLMEWQPHAYVMDGAADRLDPGLNIHRTFFARNLSHMLRGLRAVYRRHATLHDFARAAGTATAEAPAWHLARALGHELTQANNGTADPRCLPSNLVSTPLKRLNMALRWLVRTDGIVDLGVWSVITPARLRIPLDVHVADTSRRLGLTSRRSNDRRTVEEITAALRRYRPDDPAIYDFALFGIGMKL